MIARILGMAAAASLALAPVAAQAGTRAPAANVPFDGLTPVHHILNEDELEGAWLFGDIPPAVLIALGAGLFAGLILIVTGGSGDQPETDASFGTGG